MSEKSKKKKSQVWGPARGSNRSNNRLNNKFETFDVVKAISWAHLFCEGRIRSPTVRGQGVGRHGHIFKDTNFLEPELGTIAMWCRLWSQFDRHGETCLKKPKWNLKARGFNIVFCSFAGTFRENSAFWGQRAGRRGLQIGRDCSDEIGTVGNFVNLCPGPGAARRAHTLIHQRIQRLREGPRHFRFVHIIWSETCMWSSHSAWSWAKQLSARIGHRPHPVDGPGAEDATALCPKLALPSRGTMHRPTDRYLHGFE